MRLDWSGALKRVSSVPGVTHMITWFTSFCNMVILSSGLHLSMALQAPSKLLGVHGHVNVGTGRVWGACSEQLLTQKHFSH